MFWGKNCMYNILWKQRKKLPKQITSKYVPGSSGWCEFSILKEQIYLEKQNRTGKTITRGKTQWKDSDWFYHCSNTQIFIGNYSFLQIQKESTRVQWMWRAMHPMCYVSHDIYHRRHDRKDVYISSEQCGEIWVYSCDKWHSYILQFLWCSRSQMAFLFFHFFSGWSAVWLIFIIVFWHSLAPVMHFSLGILLWNRLKPIFWGL